MATPAAHEPSSNWTAKVVDAVRALFVMYKTSCVYQTSHPVFLKQVEEHLATVLAPLKEQELDLSFIKGQIHCGTILLDPGSKLFQSFAQIMETKGIGGFCIRPGLTAKEIVALLTILTAPGDELAKNGLQKALTREGVRNILERKVKLVDASKAVAEAPKSAPAKIGAPPPPSRTFTLTKEQPGTWEPAADRPAAGARAPFKNFVSEALSDLDRKPASLPQIIEQISNEFETRLNETVEEYRQENLRTVRRLESIKTVVFQELEHQKIPAALIDINLKILACTSIVRAVIGPTPNLPPQSPLADCIRNQIDICDCMFNGQSYTAKIIASEKTDGERVFLVTLYPTTPG